MSERSPERAPRKGHALTPEQVIAIYQRATTGGETCKIIAQDYPVTDATVRQIRNGTIWAHVTGHGGAGAAPARPDQAHARGGQHGRAQSTEDQVKEIYRRAWAGERVRDLAAEFGRLPPIISRIKYGKNWASVTGHVGDGPGKQATAKLSPLRVKKIYQRAWSGLETTRAIAASENLPPGTISNIKHGAIWASVTGHRRGQKLQDGPE